MDDDKVRCWACQADISREVHERIFGEWFCMPCTKQLRDFAHAIRRAALNDR